MSENATAGELRDQGRLYVDVGPNLLASLKSRLVEELKDEVADIPKKSPLWNTYINARFVTAVTRAVAIKCLGVESPECIGRKLQGLAESTRDFREALRTSEVVLIEAAVRRNQNPFRTLGQTEPTAHHLAHRMAKYLLDILEVHPAHQKTRKKTQPSTNCGTWARCSFRKLLISFGWYGIGL